MNPEPGPLPFALILAIWGERYGAAHINGIVQGAFDHSPGMREAVLVSDRPRPDLDPRIRQCLFPAPFNQPEFFSRGYRAKVAVLSPEITPRDLRCIYIDLDSAVIGDLGRLAALVRDETSLFMLPPTGLGFSRLRRLIDRLRPGAHFPVGNSSVLAFHAGVTPNPACLYAAMLQDPQNRTAGDMCIDDVIISSLARDIIRAVPEDCAVMLRREFMSKLPFWPRIKAALPWIAARRRHIAVVTMNGPEVKSEQLGRLETGSPIRDGRGRKGVWSPAAIGAVWPELARACRRIAETCSINDTQSRR
ncbi:hypothetical protein [Rhodobacter sp. 24-YEA-8]|uniref:hypothetical protein n=1 Tax=Rhodobacter sp. 24-YEA-8 TaxID=1884310 RepID=UPI000896C7F8|nr:hypothetical protein [Rhodobacter sp. 24-YEA-8]SEB88486.1 hypothetical protein SAMN05519105_1510 [Rhodobacter sp. 24-YEA-8]